MLYTTPQLLQLSGLSRTQLQSFVLTRTLLPVIPGGRGRGGTGLWSAMQIVAAAHAANMMTAGCDRSWINGSALWISHQEQESLPVAFAEGRTCLALFPDNQGELIIMPVQQDSSRTYRLLAAWLDLEKTYKRVMRQLVDVVPARPQPRPAQTKAPAPRDSRPVGKPVNRLPKRSVKVVKVEKGDEKK
jgi:hypothetical protein